MPCDYDRQRQLEAAKKAARDALLMGGAKIQKNPLTGQLEITGMNPAAKNGCGDACIIAGLAKQAATQPEIMAFFTTAGIKPGDAINAHQSSHRHSHKATQ